MLARSARLALILFALVPAAGARAATLWTPMASGTTATIEAISTPQPGEVIFVDSNGGIHYLSGGAFVAASVTPTNVIGFTDVAMSPNGVDGVAVGPSGKIYRSVDSGHTWSQVTGTSELTAACPDPGNTSAPLSDNLLSVQFADATTVYITGAHTDVLKSTNTGTTFTEVNKVSGSPGSCKVSPNESFGDTTWLDANNGYLMSTYFGDIFATTDGLGSTIGARKGEAVNSFSAPIALALDPSNHQRMWAVAAFGSCGSLCFVLTTDGGASWNGVTFDGHEVGLRDVSAAGGTVIAVGDSGDIYTSPDGQNFFRQVSGTNPTNNWFAVSVANATTAYVGGANGVLLVSTTANQVPDTTAPTGSISGPATLTQGQFGTYTANVTDNPGGSGVDPSSFDWSTSGLPDQTAHPTASFAFSTVGVHTITVAFKDLAGNANTATISVNVVAPVPPVVPPPSGTSPVTKTTGGATITIFKRVTVTGRKGRYIPIKLTTKHPRKFVILLELAKKPHTIFVRLTVTLNKGTRIVRLFTPKKVGTGTYRLEIHVLTTGKHSHQLGKSVKQVFVLV